MISGRAFKFLIIDELGQPEAPRWRYPFSRFGCERSRKLVSRFPHQADRIARRSVEAGSPLTKKLTPTVLGGLQ
ncbi:hypothetical protein [Brucella thiophenivorans]|uniref:Uncharacterized protein n=1 Tax=Brucella thiophenivorans TaxID=571255 RepID=A0A256FVL9_9HYPH|nr:hypothetical protein [Brucella thiophenivorans]OYR18925.1 hypothetical protein CEV31_2265 [Brucella thiophenivorans]